MDIKQFVVITKKNIGGSMYGPISGTFIMDDFHTYEEAELFLKFAKEKCEDAYIVKTGEKTPWKNHK